MKTKGTAKTGQTVYRVKFWDGSVLIAAGSVAQAGAKGRAVHIRSGGRFKTIELVERLGELWG